MKTAKKKSKNKGGMEHQEKYEKRSKKSFMHAHQVECHDRALADFTTKVTGTYKDPLPMDLSLLNLKEMQAWLGERNRMELDRKHGKKHGIQFQWGDSLCEPEYWDEEKCPLCTRP